MEINEKIKNIRISEKDAENWKKELTEGGMSDEEAEEVIARSNESTREKKIRTGQIKEVPVSGNSPSNIEIKVNVKKPNEDN